MFKKISTAVLTLGLASLLSGAAVSQPINGYSQAEQHRIHDQQHLYNNNASGYSNGGAYYPNGTPYVNPSSGAYQDNAHNNGRKNRHNRGHNNVNNNTSGYYYPNGAVNPYYNNPRYNTPGINLGPLRIGF